MVVRGTRLRLRAATWTQGDEHDDCIYVLSLIGVALLGSAAVVGSNQGDDTTDADPPIEELPKDPPIAEPTDDDDTLTGTDGDDTIYGAYGDDFLIGDGGYVRSYSDHEGGPPEIVVEVETISGNGLDNIEDLTIRVFDDGTGSDILYKGAVLAHIVGGQSLTSDDLRFESLSFNLLGIGS